MVKVADLPVFARIAQRPFKPLQLLWIHLRAVEHEEPHVGAHVRVVALSVHVVRLVRHVVGLVVIAQRSLELHARGEQLRVRLFELLDEVLRRLAPVHVVAEHDDEIEGERGVKAHHLPGHVELRLIAGAVVPHRRELQGPWLVWKRRRLPRDRGNGDRDEQGAEGSASTSGWRHASAGSVYTLGPWRDRWPERARTVPG